ncbi:MAG: aldo/keto reductase [Planctomycetota bacterium]|nr:MAG: aldo/keto reductase [Planctomycetota bacterium]
MKKKYNKIDRRNFLKTIGAAGLGSVLTSPNAKADSNEPNAPLEKKEPAFPKAPKRKLGKTGMEVSSIALGMIFDVLEQQVVLRKALEWGITYWDTADCYVGGNSELGIGKFLEANPTIRKDLFIVSKSDERDPEGMQKLLERSLERMKTDYIDMYFIHGTSEPTELSEEVKSWVANAKKSKKIRFFGFSTHKNMDQCLTAAAKLGWIDAIMTSYNFRVMQDPKMQAAVDACYKAGVGLVAMKTQARGQEIETEEDKKLVEHFQQKGFTEGQAKLKVVLQDERISSACTGRGNLSDLLANVAAALDKTKLTKADIDIFKEYAIATCSGYCAGCARICDSALPTASYVSEIMRYLMYYKSYGEQQEAKDLFAKIPGSARRRLLSTDYSLAEARCPQHLPIGKLIAEAVTKLA